MSTDLGEHQKAYVGASRSVAPYGAKCRLEPGIRRFDLEAPRPQGVREELAGIKFPEAELRMVEERIAHFRQAGREAIDMGFDRGLCVVQLHQHTSE